MFRALISVFIWINGSAILADIQLRNITLEGAKRTNIEWVKSYLGVSEGAIVPDNVDELARRKLMTTDVFISANAMLVPTEDPKTFDLKIFLLEKWTLIPVIRGAFGGGTPMTVFGVYDTHSFGRLWTLGAETRRYGDAPPSFVVWARAPRWLRGRHYLNLELWQLNRIRSIYNQEDERIGDIRSDSKIAKFTFLHPIIDPPSIGSLEYAMQVGIDIRLQNQPGSRFQPAPAFAGGDQFDLGIDLRTGSTTEESVMPTVIFDDIEIYGSRLDGVRAILQNGIVFESGVPHRKFETEIFFFKPFWSEFVFASRFVIGATALRTMHNQYFLGGFDTIRGIPDGAVVGSRAAFANLELRRQIYRFPYAQFDGSLFADTGSAANNWTELRAHQRKTIGMGMRMNIPQIYRLMLRVDYAFAVDGTKAQGINIGLNQFFQPYKPL
jgi:hypothetical protein